MWSFLSSRRRAESKPTHRRRIFSTTMAALTLHASWRFKREKDSSQKQRSEAPHSARLSRRENRVQSFTAVQEPHHRRHFEDPTSRNYESRVRYVRMDGGLCSRLRSPILCGDQRARSFFNSRPVARELRPKGVARIKSQEVTAGARTVVLDPS